ncbi:MAG: RNA polymerase sigma factor [Woeseiaceae bacterium]
MKNASHNAPKSFSELIRPHLERMYRLAYRLTGNQHDARDLIQDVMLKLYPKKDELTEVDALIPWLAKVVYRQFVDTRRRYAVRHLHIVADSEFASNPDNAAAIQVSTEDQVEAEFTVARLGTAVASLSEEHRLIIYLHDVEGYTISEIAEITEVPRGTVKSRRQRARDRLQELLRKGPE